MSSSRSLTLSSFLLVIWSLAVVVEGAEQEVSVAASTSDEIPHPDPNDEHYDNMVYLGRHHDPHEGGHRMGFHLDNGIRYIFGTAFDETHKDIADEDLQHHPVHPDALPDRTHELKTREEIIHEHVTTGKVLKGPKPFGHVDTHPLDGGVMPPKAVRVDPFFLDIHPVTNKEFAKFVKATYYETEAEKFGWSFVLASFVPSNEMEAHQRQEWEVDPEAEYWVAVPGAYWRQPEGPSTSYKYREHHPVVHVSHLDAAEYCKWVKKRLPGEREWEAAARFSHHGKKENRTLYIWGDPKTHAPINSTHHDIQDLDEEWKIAAKYANLWGPKKFPWENDAHDGWRGTSPVKHFLPNEAGIYDLTGNVWEWMRGGKHKARIVRGASYVDSLDGSFNVAATLGARDTAHGTTTTGNIGFRCAKSPKRRVEHHYKWHDEEEEGALAIEDMYGERTVVQKPRGSRGSYSSPDEDSDDNDDEMIEEKRKKKKVVKKRERISTEL